MENQQPVKEMITTQPAKTGRLSYSFQLMISLVLLFLVLAAGAYFRFSGMNWDENEHLHPDERFLTMVESSLEPVKSIGDYFNTETSTLNPNNRGYGFYVYGTLPIFIVRYLAEYLGKSGYDQVFLVGRYASAFVDLLTVFLVFLIVERLYRKPLMAVLAAAFSAFTVMQIQLSHYFTVDTFTNFFTFLAIYFAVYIATDIPHPEQKSLEAETLDGNDEEEDQPTPIQEFLQALLGNWAYVINYVLFGVALGMALSSKVSVYQIAALLPLATLIRLFQLDPKDRKKQFIVMARNILIAAIISIIVFRIGQPFAFKGPGFFGMGLNPKWIATLTELKGQTDGNVDFPPGLQWARRPAWFAFQNMVTWGFGLPLGILSWLGFFWMAWKIFKKGEWKQHGLIWGWTAVFFAMQSEVFNPTMRYLLYVYPSLSIIAAWAVFALWNHHKTESNTGRASVRWLRVRQILAVIVGVGVLSATAAWAFAFTRIYDRPVTRVEASRWIYQNVPGPINPQVVTDKGVVNLPVAFHSGATLMTGQPLVIAFIPQQTAILMDVAIPFVTDPFSNPNIKRLLPVSVRIPMGRT